MFVEKNISNRGRDKEEAFKLDGFTEKDDSEGAAEHSFVEQLLPLALASSSFHAV